MNYKPDMNRAIHLLLLLLFQYTELIYSITADPGQSENAVKRYNLQDLISQAGVQLASPLSSNEPQTQTIDVSELLSAAKHAASKQDEDIISKFTKKPVDIELSADKNGNLNLADIPGLTRSSTPTNNLNSIDLSSLFQGRQGSPQPAAHADDTHVVREEFNLGKQKLEVEAAGRRSTRYTLAKGPDGGLNLVPIVENDPDRKYEVMQPKGYEEKAGSRQQMQLTTLSQALYSPFPSEANILHLHLKGKDGKDGKPGPKGPMGVYGVKGPDGPKGPKGDAGTCSAQINGLFECTPDELDSLSNRVDYLEKICKKVENAAKKHNLHLNELSSSRPSSDILLQDLRQAKNAQVMTATLPMIEPVKKETAPTREEPRESNAVLDEKEKERLRQDAKEAIEKEVREEVARRLKEQLTLKLEREVQEKGNTRSTSNDRKVEPDEKPASLPTLTKPRDTSSDDNMNRDVFAADKKDIEPAKKKDESPPSLRSMIDIKAKLKIAELDLMDRVNQAKGGIARQS